MSIAYRPEIDGLRALAVLPVILFHGGFAGFGGGFVGVDVFFVISGYLITSILLAEHEAGTFSMVSFWERRARRILPALFLVMFVCLPAAWLWLLPPALIEFGKSLVGVSLYSSNFLFWQTSDYFAAAAELNPLLHTWSLSVEEQYYLLFPPFLLLAWRWGRGVAAGLIAAGAALSFVVAEWWLHADAAAAYFLLPARGWELGIGALLAFHLSAPARRVPPRWMGELGALVGLVLLVYAVLFFDEKTPFPGRMAVVPTLGTALLIAFATPATALGRCLAWRPLVAVGLVSYSAYLWHQPLFAFARQTSLAAPSPWLMAALALLSLLLAAASWKYVEAPFRDRCRFPRQRIFALAALGSVFFIGCGGALVAGGGFPDRLSAHQQAVAAYADYDYRKVQRSFRCQLMQRQRPADFAPECFPAGPVTEAVLVWGDSSAAALSYGLRMQSAAVAQLTAASCPPIPGVQSAKAHCEEINTHILGWVKQHRPRVVLLHAAWRHYREPGDLARLGNLLAELQRTVPASKVVVLGAIPHWEPTLPQFLLRAGIQLNGPAAAHPPAWEELQQVDAALSALAMQHDAAFVSVLRLWCPEQQCPVVAREGAQFMPTMWDDGHLTSAGSELLADILWPTLAFRPAGPQ